MSVFLGHTALLGVWPPRPNIRLGKSREWPQGSPVSKFPSFLVPLGAQYSSGTPRGKYGAVKTGEHGGQLTEAQREKKDAHWNGPAARPGYRGMFVWVAGPSSRNDCWLSVPAHFEFGARKKRLSTAMHRRGMTVTVSPATFKSERWRQARLTRALLGGGVWMPPPPPPQVFRG